MLLEDGGDNMMIKYSPQRNKNSSISYTFDGEMIIADVDGVTDSFDFTAVGDGVLQIRESEPPFDLLLDTVLPMIPIISAKRENGILYVELLKFIDDSATEEDRFPNWQEV
jgi:hypothetical protein